MYHYEQNISVYSSVIFYIHSAYIYINIPIFYMYFTHYLQLIFSFRTLYSAASSVGSYATTDRGSDRGTSILKFSEMSEGADKEAAKSIYQRGTDC